MRTARTIRGSSAQTGKTSTLRRLFPRHHLVSLDLPTEAAQAEREPEPFLRRHPPPVIDEAHYASALFRFLKLAVDAARGKHGRFLVTGSQKFTLMKGVTESLVGRAVQRLAEIGKAWRHTDPTPPLDRNVVITTPNLATGQHITASDSPDTVGPDQANDGSFSSSFHLPEGKQSGWIEVTFARERAFNTLVLVEPVGRWRDYGESRIASYRFECWIAGKWVEIAAGQVPARVQIHQVARVTAQRVRLALIARHDTPHVTEIGVYDEPVRR